MSRVVQIIIPSKQVTKISSELKKLPEVISIQIQRNTGIKPKGDVMSIQITDSVLPQLMELLEKHEIGTSPNTSISTSRPLSIISPTNNRSIISDTNESPWEEVDQTIAKESNTTINVLLIMAAAGFIAAIGIMTNAIHIVIGAMVIAPGFQPLIRISLGIISKSSSWKRGLYDTLRAYVSLISGAALASFILKLIGTTPETVSSSYLASNVLLSYWSSISPAALLITTMASFVGAILLVTNRSVLISGVMIALALIPSASLIGIAIVHGDIALLAQGGTRLILEMGLVVALSLLVLIWKRMSLHKRDMLPLYKK